MAADDENDNPVNLFSEEPLDFEENTKLNLIGLRT